MLLAVVPRKIKLKKQSLKSPIKNGISLVSNNILNHQCINSKKSVQKNENKSINKLEERVPLRSLSAERIRRKKQKMVKNIETRQKSTYRLKKDKEQVKQQMLDNISQLQNQYDQLRLKRSFITQRDLSKSAGRVRLSDVDAQYVKSDQKIYNQNSSKFINKCIPKSRINLKQQNSAKIIKLHADQKKQRQRQRQKQKQKQGISRGGMKMDKQNINENNSIQHKQRESSLKQLSRLKVSCVSQNLSTNSLSSLQVIPIGLSISLNRINRGALYFGGKVAKNHKDSRLSGFQFQKRKGIKVVSSHKNSNKSSLNNSSISLYVSRQLKKGSRQEHGQKIQQREPKIEELAKQEYIRVGGMEIQNQQFAQNNVYTLKC